MSYRISYLMPKKEFECLTGKKQPRAVSIKSQEVPTTRMPTPRRHAKPKITAEKWERTKKAKLPHKEKNRGKERTKKAKSLHRAKNKQPVEKKKKCRIHDE